jgi:cytochrome c oxidase subunit 1
MLVVTSFLVVIAMPPFSACQIMLILDRYLGAKFFDTQAGGSAVLWQHFFWIFGHPEVYILVLPAFAIASDVIPVFSPKPILATRSWLPRPFRLPLSSGRLGPPHVYGGYDLGGQHVLRHFTMIIAVPTGIKISIAGTIRGKSAST